MKNRNFSGAEKPKVSVVVPAFNARKTIDTTLIAIFNQTFRNFEVIVVDDGSTDDTFAALLKFTHSNLTIIRQKNRGLAGARNTGIHHSDGDYIAFCDADDIWEAEKLEMHVQHLDSNPEVGISFAGSTLIDDKGDPLAVAQRPKLKHISAADIFKRNPIGNGSAAVVRKLAFDTIAYRPMAESERNWWFDETLRQSEDIDAWLRFVLCSDWKVEGIPGFLTRYRISSSGLSSNLAKQYETWQRVCTKVKDMAPEIGSKFAQAAEAYQLRFLARRAFMMGDGPNAWTLARKSLAKSLTPLLEEPGKTLATLIAAAVLRLFGARLQPAKFVSSKR